MNRTYQAIRNEAADSMDPVELWALSAEIGAKYKRNAEKARFIDLTNGGAAMAQDWFMNKAPVYQALCAEVVGMLAKTLEGKSTEDILAIAAEGVR